MGRPSSPGGLCSPPAISVKALDHTYWVASLRYPQGLGTVPLLSPRICLAGCQEQPSPEDLAPRNPTTQKANMPDLATILTYLVTTPSDAQLWLGSQMLSEDSP